MQPTEKRQGPRRDALLFDGDQESLLSVRLDIRTIDPLWDTTCYVLSIGRESVGAGLPAGPPLHLCQEGGVPSIHSI
jgi:hypothetical protein